MDTLDQHILHAARVLVHEVGDAFTMEQLVAKAQVPRATVYRRIGSKAALLQRLATDLGVVFSPHRTMRTRIVQAARHVVGQYGFVNATIDQIAVEAGVGVAMVYRHFGDKDQLVWAVMEELSPRPFLGDLLHPTADVTADLLTLTMTLLPAFYTYRDILRIIVTGSPAERAYIEHLRTGSTHSLDQLTAYFAAHIDAGRLAATAHPRDLALAYLGLLFTFAVIGPTHYGTVLEGPEHSATLIVQLFLHGVQPTT